MNILNFVRKLSTGQKIVAFFLSLYFILWAISSPLIKHFAKPILLEKGLTLSSEASISFNPFLTQITVSDLSLLKGEENVLSIQKLIARVALYRIFFDEISVSEFTLTDGFINIKQNQEHLTVAGIDIKPADENNTASSAKPKIDNSDSAPSPYVFLLPKLTLNNFKINIENNDKTHSVKVNQLIIDDLSATELSQQASIEINSLIDDAELTLKVDAQLTQGKGNVYSELSVSEYPINKISHYVKELSELNGLFSLTSKQTISLTPEQIKLHINTASLTNKDLIVGYQEQFFTLENFKNDFYDIKITLDNNELTELSGTSQLNMANANVYYQESSQKLAHFDAFSLADISFHHDQAPQVNIAKLSINDIFASKNESIDLPAMVQLKQFAMTDILLSEKLIGIDQIILDTLGANIIVSKEKELANLVKLPAPEEKQEQADAINNEQKQETEVNEEKAEMLISLGSFSLINDNQISLIDNSVEPVKERKLFIDTLKVGSLSNDKNKQDQKTPFEMIGRSNKYAHFDFKGFAQPFANQQTFHLEGFLKELSLPAISRYVKQAVQMELKNGQLNTNVNVTLTGEELEGNVVVLLRGLETALANSEETGALIDQGALPFNMALGMLKDSNGDVELEVPLSGSTSDPNFGMSSIAGLITEKAIWMATQNYLMKTFIPYANIVSAAMSVGEFALKLRFEDLIYQEKQIIPNEAQQAYLQPFIALMQEKEDTRINICAISTPADIGLAVGTQVVDKKQIQQLKDIGEQREAAFKEYIIKHGNIASSRLLLCIPKIDSSEKAQPRIALSV